MWTELRPSVLAIVGADVVPMDEPGVRRGRTVVISDGRITALQDASAPLPPGARVIDGRGLHLTPGLADMHAHLGDESQAWVFLAHGVTFVRNMWGSEFHLRFAREVESGRRPGPHLLTASAIVESPLPNGRARYPGMALVSDPDDAARVVAAQARDGFRLLKVYSQIDETTLVALGKAADEHGMELVGHCPFDVSWEAAARAGMRSFEHMLEVSVGHLVGGGALPPPSSAVERARAIADGTDEDAIRRLGAQLARERRWVVPTFTVTDRITADPGPHMEDPALRWLSPSTHAYWRMGVDHPPSAAWRAAARKRLGLEKRLLLLMAAEGAPIALGTDAGARFTPPGTTVTEELRHLVDAGLTPWQALRAATADAAALAGEEGEWGVIRPGARADVLLVEGDPTVDPSVLTRPRHVVSGGFWLTREDLDTRLAELTAPPDTDDTSAVGPMATASWWRR